MIQNVTNKRRSRVHNRPSSSRIMLLRLLTVIACFSSLQEVSAKLRGGSVSQATETDSSAQMHSSLQQQKRRRAKEERKTYAPTPLPSAEPTIQPSPAPTNSFVPPRPPPPTTPLPSSQPSSEPSFLPTNAVGNVANISPSNATNSINDGNNMMASSTSYLLMPFSLTLDGKVLQEEPSFRARLQLYLEDEMSMDLSLPPSSLKVSLVVADPQQRRQLQQTATHLEYIGTAVVEVPVTPSEVADGNMNATTTFSSLPTADQVQLAQILGLENLGRLQDYMDESLSTTDDAMVILRVELDGRDPVAVPHPLASDDNASIPSSAGGGVPMEKSTGGPSVILTAILGAVVLVSVVVAFLLVKQYRDKPPPPPPLDCEILPDLADGDDTKETEKMQIDRNENTEVVLKEVDATKQSHKSQRVFSPRNLLSPSSNASGHADRGDGDDDITLEDDGSPSSINKTMNATGEEPSKGTNESHRKKPNSRGSGGGFFGKKPRKSLYSEPVVDMSMNSTIASRSETRIERSSSGSMEVTNVDPHERKQLLSQPKDGVSRMQIQPSIGPANHGYSISDDEDDSKMMFSIKTMQSNDDESMAGYSLATDIHIKSSEALQSASQAEMSTPSNPIGRTNIGSMSSGTGGNRQAVVGSSSAPTVPNDSPVPVGALAIRKWMPAPREFLSEKKSDDPYTTSDSESGRDGSYRSGRNVSMIAQLGVPGGMDPQDNPLVVAETLDGSIEVGRPDLFVDDEDLCNSSYKEEDNIRGDSSILSGLLSQASDLDIYTTTGSTFAEESVLTLPPRTHHPGGGGLGVSPYQNSPSRSIFQRLEPEEEVETDDMIIPEPPAVRHHNYHQQANQGKLTVVTTPASLSSASPHGASPSYDEFSPTSRVLRQLAGTQEEDEGHAYQRNSSCGDSYSDVPSDERNALEQDLGGFGQQQRSFALVSATHAITQQAMNRQVVTTSTPYTNYTLPQSTRQQQVQQHYQQVKQGLVAWSTPERNSAHGTQLPPSPKHSQPTGTAASTLATSGHSHMQGVSPASAASSNYHSQSPNGSWELDDAGSGEAEYDATISQYLKERRRIKRATRKHRAERKQPPVTMEV